MEIEKKVMEYKRTRDPVLMREIIEQFKPLINKTVNTYNQAPMDNNIVEMNAKILLADAIKSYNPTKGKFSTHAYNYMKGMNRLVNNTSIVYVPENRKNKLRAYEEAHDDFWNKYNRLPTNAEMADKMALPEAEIRRLAQESGRKVMYGSDVEASIVGQMSNEGTLLEFVYNKLTNENTKKVLEYKMGLHGKPKLKTNSEIARRLNMSESNVRKLNDKIIQAIRWYQ